MRRAHDLFSLKSYASNITNANLKILLYAIRLLGEISLGQESLARFGSNSPESPLALFLAVLNVDGSGRSCEGIEQRQKDLWPPRVSRE